MAHQARLRAGVTLHRAMVLGIEKGSIVDSDKDRKDKERKIEELIEKVCRKENVSIKELRSGGRRGKLPVLRKQIAGNLIAEYGLSLAELGRRLGVTTSAVSKMMTRHE